jgi:D-aminopeptidase
MVMVCSPLLLIVAAAASAAAPSSPRARDLGVPFDFGRPGRWNAITDVAGVEVGHVTRIEGADVRTGVTAVLPRGKGDAARVPVFAGAFALNGNGEMTGVHWLDESGLLEGPLMLTNTADVGAVRDAVMRYGARRFGADAELWTLPLAAETWDLHLNDMYGGHVRAEHAVAAIEGAAAGPVAEGNVGGGTGMICFEFKGGIGTSSRVLEGAAGGYTVGVLVQANFGRRHQLRVGGLPVGRQLGGSRVYEK